MTPRSTSADRSSRRDLDDEAQIAELVRRFYRDVAQDDLLGPVFVDVAQVDWDEHLPKLTAFWCRALLGQSGYVGNPFRAHADVHRVHPLRHEHFERWLSLFEDTIVAWNGPNVERALALARRVAEVHAGQLVGREAPSTTAPVQISVRPSSSIRADS